MTTELDKLLANAKPATPEETEAQRAGMLNYKPGERQVRPAIRVWLHGVTKLSELKTDVDRLVLEHGHDAKIEIESAGYGRICLDVLSTTKAIEPAPEDRRPPDSQGGSNFHQVMVRRNRL